MANEKNRAQLPPQSWIPTSPHSDSFVAKYHELTEDQQRAFGAALTNLCRAAARAVVLEERPYAV